MLSSRTRIYLLKRIETLEERMNMYLDEMDRCFTRNSMGIKIVVPFQNEYFEYLRTSVLKDFAVISELRTVLDEKF